MTRVACWINLQRSCEAFGFIRSGVHGGEQEKEADHRKYKSARQKSGNAQFGHAQPCFLFFFTFMIYRRSSDLQSHQRWGAVIRAQLTSVMPYEAFVLDVRRGTSGVPIGFPRRTPRA
jgi:hypothetical protein